MGFLAGLVSGPHLLADLDLDVYYVAPAARVYCWGFLCAIGSGLLAAVLLTLTGHRRKSGSSVRQGLKKLLVAAALAAFPAYVFWAYAFTPREAAVRSRCSHCLGAIVRALHEYQERFGHLPPAFIADENGRPKHSWRVLILPYLEETGMAGTEGLKQLYASYDLSEPWDGPHNRKLARRMPIVYGCQGDPRKACGHHVLRCGRGRTHGLPGPSVDHARRHS